MVNVIVKLQKGEPVDRALKRLKNKVDAEGILETVRVKRAFENNALKERRKAKKLQKSIKLARLKRS
jgi:small subunit ribosomal protein S21